MNITVLADYKAEKGMVDKEKEKASLRWHIIDRTRHLMSSEAREEHDRDRPA